MKTLDSSKKIGILGGSFDPVHMGHLRIAQSAYEEYQLDEVWFIPAGHSPNKNEEEMTSAVQRAEMVKIAIADYPYFQINMMEIETTETSYTYLTLSRLKEQYPDNQFYFIMGADSLDYFDKWYHPEIICQKAVILAAVRDNLELQAIQEKICEIKKLFFAEIYPINGGKTDVSSTELRDRKKSQLLPPGVLEYIKKQGLYGYGNE